MCKLDKLGKQAYHKGKPLFVYKNTVRVPPLEMVDDLAIATLCNNYAIIAISIVNTFVENQKLTLSNKKCHQIHFGKPKLFCSLLNVHESKMKRSEAEKYLGNITTSDGSNKTNSKSRVSKGFGFVAEILSIVKEIPFGQFQLEVALKLRESMLINGMLTSSEVCYGISKIEIENLEKVNEYLLREVLQAQSKTPIEMLYLETGVLPIKFVLISRRLSYLKHILDQNDHELINKFYVAQKRNPVRNDWVLTVDEDKILINYKYSDNQIKEMSKRQFKKILKEKVQKSAFILLQSIKETHSKVNEVIYYEFSIQKYLTSSKFTMKEKQLLFKRRTRMLDTKANFKNMHTYNLKCDYCDECDLQTQRHLLEDCDGIISNCEEVSDNVTVEHDDIFGEPEEQLRVTKLYIKIQEIIDTVYRT